MTTESSRERASTGEPVRPTASNTLATVDAFDEMLQELIDAVTAKPSGRSVDAKNADAERVDSARAVLHLTYAQACEATLAPSPPASEGEPQTRGIEDRRNAFAVATIRSALRQGRRVGGQNATVHVGDVLEVMDQIAHGKMDAALDDPDEAVSGPTFLSSTHGAKKS